MADTIDFEILEDGTISISTDNFKSSNHISADELIEEVLSESGGEVTRRQKPNEFWKNRTVVKGGKVVKLGGKH